MTRHGCRMVPKFNAAGNSVTSLIRNPRRAGGLFSVQHWAEGVFRAGIARSVGIGQGQRNKLYHVLSF